VKKIAIISSFCDNQEKIDILSKNIDTVKNLGLDVLVVSPISLPQELVKQCDYFLYTKDNPVLDWPTKAMYFWREMNYNRNEKIKITKTYADYGWAGLYQVKKTSEIALSLDYDYFYHMIYDLVIDENVINGFNSTREKVVYPSKRDETIWAVGLHFMIFDRENLTKFISYINLESYLNVKGGDAFVWLHTLQQIFPFEIESTPVSDAIFYYDNKDFFDISPLKNKKYKIFVAKNDETQSSIKLLFYNVIEEEDIVLIVEGISHNFSVKNNTIFDLGFNKFNFKEVIIETKNEKHDLTNIIKNTKHTTLSIL
jgi:hypothetical protein